MNDGYFIVILAVDRLWIVYNAKEVLAPTSEPGRSIFYLMQPKPSLPAFPLL